jgi:hypothetical protein
MADNGRTIWEIITGANKQQKMPLELQGYNPLQAKIGCTVSLKNDVRFQSINFVIERITVYDTPIGGKNFRHIDYHCKGTSLETEGFVRFRLRLLPNEDATNEIGCTIQVLFLYDEFGYDQGFQDNVLGDPEGIFNIEQDDFGKQLPPDQVRRYWRVEDVRDPYHSKALIYEDEDKSGKVDETEMRKERVTSWDYSRITQDENGTEFTEFLTVEMDDSTRYFAILRGTEALAEDVLIY